MAKSLEAIIGRKREQAILGELLDSGEPELLTIYGRRRVGKTHLLRMFFEARAEVMFTVTGEKDAPLAVQLHHFRRELERVFYAGAPLPELRSWREALGLLADAAQAHARRSPSHRIVLLLDELPWLGTRRSGLLQALDHCWNTRLSRLPQLKLLLCGSAASWMLEKLVHAKGGLYNRVTRRIALEPFDLGESRDYLRHRRVESGNQQILELYMAIGGVPHYLKQARRGASAAQNIGEMCFEKDGGLHGEFPRLFDSLFVRGELHEAVVRALAGKRRGMTHGEIVAATHMTSGGRLKSRLEELEAAGFIFRSAPYGRRKKDTLWRLGDEYCAFYLRWVEKAPRVAQRGGAAGYWQSRARSPAARAWAGYTFEGICLKHVSQIARALGIEGVATDIACWRHAPARGDRFDHGAQVDLLFDRADGIINLCEIKYSTDPFVIDKSYARDLKRKLQVFEATTATRKDVHLTLIAPRGLKRNVWSEDLVSSVVSGEALFA